MARKFPHWLVVATLVYPASSAFAQSNDDDKQTPTTAPRVKIIEPGNSVNSAQPAAIDTEKFQLGLFLGHLSVEDFGSDLVSGVELSYHLSHTWMLQASYGSAAIDQAAFETSQLQFLASSDRDFTYFGISAGYRWLQGRSFMGSRAKYNSDIYLLAGLEQVSFAANDEVGLNVGLSYRVVLTDWLTMNVDFREHVFKREFIGDSKQTLNTEFRIGFNGLF